MRFPPATQQRCNWFTEKGHQTATPSRCPRPAPQPLTYLEQFDQPAFRAQWGLSTSDAQTLKASLADSPGAVKVDDIARANGDGSISVFDGPNNNAPIVSDLDLQYIQPANAAPWLPGKQAQIQLEFQNQLQQNLSRLTNHGASGTARDLPAQAIQVADGFVMSTTDPAVAQAVATNLARRYASQSAIFASNAARLNALAAKTSDPVLAQALRTQAASYRATAGQFATVDAAYLLAKYPPGEIIVIKLGDVRVRVRTGREVTPIEQRHWPAKTSTSTRHRPFVKDHFGQLGSISVPEVASEAKGRDELPQSSGHGSRYERLLAHVRFLLDR